MARRYIPDPAAVAAAVAGRVDTLERRLARLETIEADITALGRGIANLTSQVRSLAAASTSDSAASGDATAAPTPGTADAEEGQPDWMRVTDAATAVAWLTAVDRWLREVLRPLGLRLSGTCWPLHPLVVAELLALVAEHEAAYSGPKTTPVSEWLARWLPGAGGRIARELDRCTVEGGHVVNGRAYDVSRLDLAAVGTWWADTHGEDPDAVQAFALTRVP